MEIDFIIGVFFLQVLKYSSVLLGYVFGGGNGMLGSEYAIKMGTKCGDPVKD